MARLVHELAGETGGTRGHITSLRPLRPENSPDAWEMDNSPGIAWIKDEEGRHVYLSRSFEQRFGVKLDDWRGKTDFELWPLETAQTFRNSDLAVLGDGQTREVIEETRSPDGSPIHWWSFKFLIRDAAGRRYVAGSGVDITARKQSEEEVRRHVEELRASNEQLTRLTRAMTGRELRMMELKKEVNELCAQAGQPPRYATDHQGAQA
jgi:PAS domain S-box-containing protein